MSITSLKRNPLIGRNSLTSLDTQADQPTLGLCICICVPSDVTNIHALRCAKFNCLLLRNYCLLRYISCIFGLGMNYNITYTLNLKWCAPPHYLKKLSPRFNNFQRCFFLFCVYRICRLVCIAKDRHPLYAVTWRLSAVSVWFDDVIPIFTTHFLPFINIA